MKRLSMRVTQNKILSILCFLGLTVLITLTLTPAAHAKENPLYASIVIDADTGAILSQSNPDKKLHPASLTKIMTLLMLFEAIEAGQLNMNSPVPISQHAASMAPSKIGLKPGSTIKVRDAIGAIVTKSANDISAAVGEKLGGTERNFARLMTIRAGELGMSKTTFKNASGLHDSGQITTARDMAILARTVISTYPSYYRNFSMSNFTYRGVSYHNHNGLMKTYRGMDGMKTGFIRQSGFNLVASAVRKDRRIIGVVFGGRTANSRNEHMASLLDQGFSKLGRGGAVQYASAATVPVLINAAPPAAARSYEPPLPPQKPGILVAYDTLNKISNTRVSNFKPSPTAPAPPVAVADNTPYSDTAEVMNIASLSQGDAAEPLPETPQASSAQTASLTLPAKGTGSWSIQVGAFSSRASTDKIMHESLKKLPPQYRQGSPMIAPLKTGNGWIFRARLTGYTKDQAEGACRYLKECMAVAP